jgi:hypothetical protein
VGDLLRIDRVHSVDGARRELLARSAGPAVNAVVDDKTSLCFYIRWAQREAAAVNYIHVHVQTIITSAVYTYR